MKLVTFRRAAGTGIGVLLDDGSVADLAADPSLPTRMVDFVALGDEGLTAAAAIDPTSIAIGADRLELAAPIRPV